MMENPTFMRVEIDEAAEAIARQLRANAPIASALGERLRAIDPLLVATIARGSSDHCALYLKHLIEIVLGVPGASIGPSVASIYRAPLRLDRSVAVSVSQSGRSPDIVEMQRAARRGGALTIAFVNDAASPLATEAEALMPLWAGVERSVAATKSMIAGLVAGASLVAEWRDDAPLRTALAGLPQILGEQRAAPPETLVETLAGARSAFVLGRGATLAIAAEAALKLKETCAIHAEAYSSAEVLHGPAELVAPGFPIIAFIPPDAAREGMEATLERLSSAGARLVRIETGGADGDAALASAPTDSSLLAPIAMIHRFYGLAEAVARRLGRDPDHPRHLRKVTETV